MYVGVHGAAMIVTHLEYSHTDSHFIVKLWKHSWRWCHTLRWRKQASASSQNWLRMDGDNYNFKSLPRISMWTATANSSHGTPVDVHFAHVAICSSPNGLYWWKECLCQVCKMIGYGWSLCGRYWISTVTSLSHPMGIEMPTVLHANDQTDTTHRRQPNPEPLMDLKTWIMKLDIFTLY